MRAAFSYECGEAAVVTLQALAPHCHKGSEAQPSCCLVTGAGKQLPYDLGLNGSAITFQIGVVLVGSGKEG